MQLTDKVLIDNLCSWNIYFKRLNGVGDICIPGGVKNFSMLDVAEVQLQIQMNNIMFVGDSSNPNGDHARLYIVDDEQRKALLGLDSDEGHDVIVLNEKTVSALLAIKSKEKFKEQLQALVKTDAEKRMVVDIANKVGGDEVANWKMKAIEEIAVTSAI